MFSTGLRVSELVSLDREQVNLQSQEFGVMGKGRRTVVFLSDLATHWRTLFRSAHRRLDAGFRHAEVLIPPMKARRCASLPDRFSGLLKSTETGAHSGENSPIVSRYLFATDLL